MSNDPSAGSDRARPQAQPLRRLRWMALGLCALACAGCKPSSSGVQAGPAHPEASTSAAASAVTNSLVAQFAARDLSVWGPEADARVHEGTFVRLADELRRAPDATVVLGQLAFNEIVIPRPEGDPAPLALGIQQQHFSKTNPLALSQAAWTKALTQFRQAGWAVSQAEFHHEKFVPAANGNPALSEFAFVLHGEQRKQTNRFILRGTLQAEWASGKAAGQAQPLGRITVIGLTLLERAGPPGFSQHALIAPEPERPGGQVNLHPLLVLDLNQDGHDDIVLPGANKVLLNDGKAQLRPVELIQREQFYPGQAAGVCADFTGDGLLDLLGVADMGPAAKMLTLYAGRGSVPFTTPPVAAWEQQRREFARYRFTAISALTAGDIDGDGDLDVFAAQYRPPYVDGNLPTPYYDANDGYPSYLLRNDGRGQFVHDQSQSALGIKGHRRTLAASLVDLDNDGDLDLVTLNDFSGVDLFYNDGHGQFSDQTARLGNRHLFGMGHACADLDSDGALDLLAIGMDIPTVRRLEALGLAPAEFPDRTRRRREMAWGNRVYLARGERWVEPPWAAAPARTGWGWGVSAFDLENDGDLDCYIANGHVSGASSADYDTFYWTRDIYLGGSREDRALQHYFDETLRGLNTGQTSWNGYQHNAFLLDTGTNDYVNVAWLMGVAHETDCRAVVSADLNEDGRPDLLVTEALWQGSPHTLRHRLLVHLNELPAPGHWLGVRLPVAGGRPSPIGAKVFAHLPGRTLVRQVITGDSFQAQHPFTVHFGLGTATNVSAVRIVWPDGSSQVLALPAVDRYHEAGRP